MARGPASVATSVLCAPQTLGIPMAASEEMTASLPKLNPQASVFVPTWAPPAAGPPPNRPASAPARESKVPVSDFLPSDVFAGPQPGMSFKHGPHGLGYYADKRLARQQAGPDAAAAKKKKKKGKKKPGEDAMAGGDGAPATATDPDPAGSRKAGGSAASVAQGQPADAASAAPAPPPSGMSWASRAAAVVKPASDQASG